MTFFFKAGHFSKSTSTSTPFDQNNAISAIGFQPKILWMCGIAISNFPDWSTDLRHSIGFTTGTTSNYSIGIGSDEGVTTSNTFRRAQNNYCFCHGSSGSTTGALIKLKSFDAGGASFTYDRNDSNGYELPYIAIGGTDITNVASGSFTPAAGTAPYTQDITGLGFEPDMVFFLSAVTNPPTSPGVTSISNQVWMQGAAKTGGNQHVMAYGSVDNVGTSQSNRSQRTDSCILWYSPGVDDTIDGRASYTGTVTGGFRITWQQAPATRPTNGVFYLAVKGGQWDVGSLVQPTAAQPQTQAISTLGYAPKGLFFYSNQQTAQTTSTADLKFTWGAASSSAAADQWVVLGGDEDAMATMTSVRMAGPTYCIASQNNDSTPADADLTSRASLQSFDTGAGFTLNWNVTTATARQVLYVACGDSQVNAIVKVVSEGSVYLTEATAQKRTRTQVVPAEGSLYITDAEVKLVPKAKVVNEGSLYLTEATAKKRTRNRVASEGSVYLTEGKVAVKPLIKKTPVPEEIQNVESLRFVFGKKRQAPLETIQDVETTGLRRGRFRKVPSVETINVQETKVRKIQFYEAAITPNHLVLHYSGGTNNQDNTLSLGGAKSNYAITGTGMGGFEASGFMTSGFMATTGQTSQYAWDIVLQSEALTGKEEYRCYYLVNKHGTLTAYELKMWFSSNSTIGYMALGKGSSAAGVQEQGPFLQETTPPDSVVFSQPTDETTAVSIGNIGPNSYQSIWLKRVIPAGATASIGDGYTLQCSFYTSFA